MLKHFLENNPLVSQRIRAMKITKGKEESISDVMHRINDAYISAELDKCPVETFVLLHLLTLLPSDPLSEKVKTWLVEAMRVEPNIKTLEKASAYIQQQECDSIASKGVQEDRKVNLVKPEDEVKLPKKEILCKICQKTHPKFKCGYQCMHCSRKGHRSESCWNEFPEIAPNYPGKRADTPAADKLPKVVPKKRDRRASSA